MSNYKTSQNLALLVGRILFSVIFILSGFNKVFNLDSTVVYMTQAGMDFYVQQLAIGAIIFELGGGLMILVGWHARLGAFLLFVFCLAVNFFIHHFWTYPTADVQIQMINFFKNITIVGGTLYIMSFGAGRYSFDGIRRTKFVQTPTNQENNKENLTRLRS